MTGLLAHATPTLRYLGGVPGQRPCLFNIRTDVSKQHDLGGDPGFAAIVDRLWGLLNLTVLTYRDCSTGYAGSAGK